MRRLSEARFNCDPVGAWVSEGHALGWCGARDLIGGMLWGSPSVADIDLLTRMWDLLQGHVLHPYDFVFDTRAMEHVEVPTYMRISQAVLARLPFKGIVRRQIVLASAGLAGGIAHGFLSQMRADHEWRVFADEGEGLAWLGRPDRVEIAAWHVATTRMLTAEGTLLAQLRQWLLGAPRGELEAAAVALKTSRRNLQRSLAAAGTTFSGELREARLARARRLLADPESKVEAVALAVGYRSVSRFVGAFRERFGETPGVFRDRVHPQVGGARRSGAEPGGDGVAQLDGPVNGDAVR